MSSTTVRFDKGSPSPLLYMLSSLKRFDFFVTTSPTTVYKQLIDVILDIELKTNNRILRRNQIAITNGVLAGLFIVLPLLLNRNGKIIINDLCFEGTTSLIKTLNMIPVTTDYTNKIAMENAVKKSYSRVMFINSPENPSGKIYDEEFLIFVSYLTKKYGIIVISDEVNNQKIYPPYKFISPSKFIPANNLIVLNSFTKNYFLSGIRLGWITGNKNFIKKINNIILISQVGINYPSQIIATFIIKNFMKEINDYKNILYNKKICMENALNKYGLPFMQPVMAGTVIFVKTNINSVNLSNNLLNRYNIGVIPGILFGRKWSKWIRLGFGCVSDKNIENGIKNISKISII